MTTCFAIFYPANLASFSVLLAEAFKILRYIESGLGEDRAKLSLKGGLFPSHKKIDESIGIVRLGQSDCLIEKEHSCTQLGLFRSQ